MAEVKWIKIVTNMFDDEKIRVIESATNGDQVVVIWFKLLCLAGKSNQAGFLMLTDKIPYTDEMLADIFQRPLKLVRSSLTLFERLGMIEIIENKIYLSNWEKHQNTDGLQKVRSRHG